MLVSEMIDPLFLLVIFGCQILGEALKKWFQLPIPGAVTGMLSLLATFAVAGR